MSWEEGRGGYDGELEALTPQQKEEMIREANERRQRDYVHGRRAVWLMLLVYGGMQTISLVLGFFMIPGNGYYANGFLAWLLQLAIAVTLVYNIWHGRLWARNIFTVLLVLSLFLKVQDIFSLDIARTDYSDPASSKSMTMGTIYIGEDGTVKSYNEMGRAEIAQLQKSEDQRVRAHRILLVIYLIDCAICAAYLYVLLGYPPAKEFFYRQRTET